MHAFSLWESKNTYKYIYLPINIHIIYLYILVHMYLFTIAMLARFVVEQCSLCRKAGWQRFACWSFICLQHFYLRFLSSYFSRTRWICVCGFCCSCPLISLRRFFVVAVFVCDFDNLQLFERNGKVNGRERKRRREQHSTVGQIEKRGEGN